MIIKILKSPTEKPRILPVPHVKGLSLKKYLRCFDLKDKDVIVNGKIVDVDYVPKKNDEIIVKPKVEAPVVWAIGYGIGYVAGFLWAFATAHPFIAAFLVLGMGYSVYSYLSAPRAPSYNTGQGLDQNSPTYTWEGGHTIQDVGVPVPIVYGEHKVWGNIINQYQSTDGDKNYIHVLLLLCEGEVCDIEEVKVNDIAVEEYQDATYEIRKGANDQEPINGFSELHSLNDINIRLQQNQPITYRTKLNNVEAFEVYFSFPNGLYQQETQVS